MNIFKHFTRGFTSTSASCMILLTAAGGTLAFTPASRDDQRLPMFYGTNPGSTHTKKDAAASATNQSVTSPAANSANVIIRDHRTPEGSQPANTPPAPSAKPTGTVVRDHRPGGNEDPCLKPKNTCNASDRNNSIVAYREKHPDLIGLDGDPCFQTKGKSCTQGQMIESMIARTEKNLNSGWCDPRITGQDVRRSRYFPVECKWFYIISVMEGRLSKPIGNVFWTHFMRLTIRRLAAAPSRRQVPTPRIAKISLFDEDFLPAPSSKTSEDGAKSSCKAETEIGVHICGRPI